MNRPFFVATEDMSFWSMGADTLVFANRGLLRYNAEDEIKKEHKVEFLKPMFESNKEQEALYGYLDSIGKRIKPYIVEALNTYNHCNYDQASWELLIHNWVYSYINHMCRCFSDVRAAKEKYPDIVSSGIDLKEKKYVLTTGDYIRKTCDSSEFVVQLYTYAFDWFDIPYNINNYESEKKTISPLGTKRRPNIGVRPFLWYIENLLARYNKGEKIVFSSVYLPYHEISLPLKLRLRVFNGNSSDAMLFREGIPSVDRSFRENAQIKYTEDDLKNDSFFCFLCAHILSDIPLYWMEGFETLKRQAHKLYPEKPKAILSSVCYYHDEFFKFYATEQHSLYKSKTIEPQHGGNYGLTAFVSYCRTPVDLFYSWGWRQGSGTKRMPAGKLCGRKKYLFSQQRDILYSSTCLPCFYHSFTPLQDGISYTERIKTFISSLPDFLRKELAFRKYQNEYTWDISARLRDAFPELRIEDWSIPIIERMYQSRLFVVDHLSTTWIEAISLGIPTVMVFDPGNYSLTDEAQKTLALLESAGIYHRSPEAAAKFVAEIYDDAWGWWNKVDVQEAVRQTKELWGWTPDNWKEIWRDELMSLLE